MNATGSSLAGCSGEEDARQHKKPRTDDDASAEHALTEPGKSEDWKSTFQRASSELVRYMAKELHAIELNAPGLSAAVEDPFQVDEVMTGDEGTVTLCITRGNNKPIYVQNVLP